MITGIAGWVAPAATMIAAMMTAANLGARVTGWGFVVFVVGSACWAVVGFATGQHALLATNGFLFLVNLGGVWRWLVRQRVVEDGGRSAARASRRSASPSLFTATGIAGMCAKDSAGRDVGKAVEALIECRSARLNYMVIAEGAADVTQTLRAVRREEVRLDNDSITLAMSRADFQRLPALPDGDWPASLEKGEARP